MLKFPRQRASILDFCLQAFSSKSMDDPNDPAFLLLLFVVAPAFQLSTTQQPHSFACCRHKRTCLTHTSTMRQSVVVTSLLALVATSSAFVPISTTSGRTAISSLSSSVDDKTEVREYFNTEGFSRWNKIYSESDDVNSVQLDIRTGHDQTIQKILKWIETDGDIAGKTVCDCGCGVGSLAIPLAQMGAKISASDISDSMADEAGRRAAEMGIKDAKFYTSDLESVTGSYDMVSCVDVAIHYPSEKMSQMIDHLCSLSNDRVVISFAPHTWYYVLLKKIGELFPGPSKTTRAYLHEESLVRDALARNGFEISKEEMTATNFYFSRLFEARKKA